MRLLRREHWDRGTIACPNWSNLMPQNTSMAVRVAGNEGYTTIHAFALFSFSSCFRCLVPPNILYSWECRSAGGSSTVQLCDWCPVGTASSIGMLSPRQRCCHTIYQSLPWALCCLPRPFHHVQSYYISSPSPVFTRSYFQKHFYLELETLWERPVSMLFFLTGGKEKVAFRQFIKFCLDQGTILWYCAKPQSQLSVRCQKIIYT